MDTLIKNTPKIITQAARSTRGLLALMILAIAVLGYFYFSTASELMRFAAFSLLTLGVALFATAVVRSSAKERVQAQLAQPPVFGLSIPFQYLEGYDEKKPVVDALDNAIKDEARILTPFETQQCAGNRWDLDRIGLYIWERHKLVLKEDEQTHIRVEYRRIRGKKGSPSTFPIYYAVESYLEVIKAKNKDAADKQELNEILNYMQSRSDIDTGGQVKEKLSLLIERAPGSSTS